MTLADALQSLRPGAEFTFNNDDISTITWHTEGVTTPSQEEIDNEIKRLEAEELEKVTSKAAAKESALAKLTALGLSGEEIAAITNN
jgi:hypothetical protein